MDAEREDVIRRLREYRDEIERLMNMLGNKQRLTADERAEMQSGYRALKEKIRAEYHQGSTVRGAAELNETERHFFLPAISRAAGHIDSPTNTNPLKQEWLSGLYQARGDIEQFLNPLEQQT